MKTLQNKIEDTLEKMKDLALDIVQDMELHTEFEGNVGCYVNKGMYEDFQVLQKKIDKLHEKKIKEDEAQLKFALK